jgi:hypothetical protein
MYLPSYSLDANIIINLAITKDMDIKTNGGEITGHNRQQGQQQGTARPSKTSAELLKNGYCYRCV